MRNLMFYSLMALTSFCLGQGYELVETENEVFYKIMKDSIDLNLEYPDGRYKIFLSDTNELPNYVFYIKYGKVDGPFLELNRNNYTYGTYSKDSLWTFITNNKDTTFKIGTWLTVHESLGYSGKYDNFTSYVDVFKMPFDENGQFIETWRFHNGQLARKSIFKRGFGLEKKTIWDFESNEVANQTVNSGTKNYYQSIKYENDSISYVSIIQNGIEIIINFENRPYSCQSRPCTVVNIYDEKWENKRIPMASISIDSSNTLTDYRDIKRQIYLNENEEGNINLQYHNKHGKTKYKKLK